MNGRHHYFGNEQREKYWQSKLAMQFKFQSAQELSMRILCNCIFPKK